MRRLLLYLLPFAWIVVAGVAIFAVVRFHAWIPVVVGVLVIALFSFWILGCTFSSAVPDRRCPRCQEEGLVRLRKDQMLGVRCTRCGYENPEMYRAYLDEV